MKYTIIIESSKPPDITLGQYIGGGTVIELKQNQVELVTASDLAIKYNLSVDTVRRKLEHINQGTSGKSLYNLNLADEILQGTERKKGRKRIN